MVASKTDSPSLKRTLILVSGSSPSSPADRRRPKDSFAIPLPIYSPDPSLRMSLSLKRRYPFCKSSTATTSIDPSKPSAPSVPSFVSIFDTDIDMSGCSSAAVSSQFPHDRGSVSKDIVAPAMTGVPLQHPIHQQHGSLATSPSSSTNSSPTTTISTVESAITEDNTPDSSPDSTVRIMPLSFRSVAMSSSEDFGIVPPSPLPGCSRSISPSKKPRNTKNLSLNVPPPSVQPQTQTQPASAGILKQPSPRSMSAPTSPAFIKPPPPSHNPRRRPSNLGLTIKLPGSLPEKSAVRGPVGGPVGVLRHHQSSPSLLSPGPKVIHGGMRLPPTPGLRQPRLFQPPRQTFSNYHIQDSFSTSPSSGSTTNSPPRSPEILHEMDEEDEEPRSGEVKSPAYPAGPACIFDPNIYLYAEPDAELASQFDVVINVAREVINPFKVAGKNQQSAALGAHHSVRETDSLPPDTACTEASFTTAFEEALFSPISSRKPKLEMTKPKLVEPEYVHMPWDHNTAILDDLPYLVNLINDRATVGKKVLIHCQCGVSRSATLLIAYAMFKSPEKSMLEAYNAVKGRSKWIGPNMSLIYQLTDWKKRIMSDSAQAGFGGWRIGNPGGGGGRGYAKAETRGGFGRSSASEGLGVSDSIPEPQTAPLPELRNSPPLSPLDRTSGKSKDHPIPQMVRTRSENGGFITGVSPGPSSAPPGMITIPGSSEVCFKRQSWPEKEPLIHPQRQGSPSHRPLGASSAEKPKPDFVHTPVPPAGYLIQHPGGLFGRDVGDAGDNAPPPTPSFSSPRNSGYFPVPIKRSGAFAAIFTDPRSPTQRGETPIVRSIFDVL